MRPRSGDGGEKGNLFLVYLFSFQVVDTDTFGKSPFSLESHRCRLGKKQAQEERKDGPLEHTSPGKSWPPHFSSMLSGTFP